MQTKTVRIFPNNKPWIPKELEGILIVKNMRLNVKTNALNKEFRSKMKVVKLEYKKLLSGNISDAWKGLNRMVSRTCKEQMI